MRIEIPQKTLSDRQKASIVSRGEQLSRNNLYFEMDARYAATLSKLSNIYGEHFKVNVDPISIYFDDYIRQESVNGYDEDGKWKEMMPSRSLANLLADKYANGEIQLGGDVNSIMQEFADIYQRIDEIHANTERIDAKKRLKEEEERPAKEARERAEKEETDKKDAEEKAKAEADKAKQAAEAEIRQKEMFAWAQDHGSSRLRKGLEHGHACKKLYETELGEHLIQDNGYEYDREDQVEVKGRSCPSLVALEEVERIEKIEGLSASVVWLPEGLTALHKDPEKKNKPESGCEAVKIDVKGTAGFWYKVWD